MGADRDSRYSGARRGIGASGGSWDIGGVRECQGCVGVACGLGAQPHWAPVQGPSTPTGSPGGVTYLSKAKQVTEIELCRLLYTFGTMFCDSFHICIYATSSHILVLNIKKCYMDYFLCRPIYTYPYMINLMYYDTMVLIMNRYFSHQISKLVHLPWVYVHSSIFDTDLV